VGLKFCKHFGRKPISLATVLWYVRGAISLFPLGLSANEISCFVASLPPSTIALPFHNAGPFSPQGLPSPGAFLPLGSSSRVFSVSDECRAMNFGVRLWRRNSFTTLRLTLRNIQRIQHLVLYPGGLGFAYAAVLHAANRSSRT
jgi:hypothetical protein